MSEDKCPDVECQRRKVGWSHLIVMGAIISVLGGAAVASMQLSAAQDRQNNSENIKDNREAIRNQYRMLNEINIKVEGMSKDIEVVKDKAEKSEKNQEKILEEIRRGNNRRHPGGP